MENPLGICFSKDVGFKLLFGTEKKEKIIHANKDQAKSNKGKAETTMIWYSFALMEKLWNLV